MKFKKPYPDPNVLTVTGERILKPKKRFRLPFFFRFAVLACLAGPTLASAVWEPIPGFQPLPDPWRSPNYHTNLPSLFSDRDGSTYLSVRDTLSIRYSDGAIQKIASTRDSNLIRFSFKVAKNMGILYWGPQHSIDGGRTWSRMPSISNFQSSMTACDDGSALTGGSYETISFTVDSGRTWKNSNYMTSYGRITDIRCMSKGWVLAASTTGPLRGSIDGGKTWKAIKNENQIQATYLAADPISPDSLVWAIDQTLRKEPSLHTVCRLIDTVLASTRFFKSFPESTVTAWAVSATSISERRLWLGTWGQGILFSDDSGSTWKDANAGLRDLHISAMTLTADGTLLAMNEDGLFSKFSAPVVSLTGKNQVHRKQGGRAHATASGLGRGFGLEYSKGVTPFSFHLNGRKVSPRGTE